MRVTKRVSNIQPEDIGAVSLQTLEDADITAMPLGAIMLWVQDISLLPSGWVLCDGSNGTPDLNDTLVRQVDVSSENLGDTGGSFMWPYELTVNHTGYTNNHTLTIAQMPVHSHGLSTGSQTWHAESSDFVREYFVLYTGADSAPRALDYTGNSQGHKHTMAYTLIERDDTSANRPEYMKVAYVMYIGD